VEQMIRNWAQPNITVEIWIEKRVVVMAFNCRGGSV